MQLFRLLQNLIYYDIDRLFIFIEFMSMSIYIRNSVRKSEKRIDSVPTDEEDDSIASRMKRRRNHQPNDDDDDNNSYEY